MAKKLGLPIVEGVAIIGLIAGLFAKGNMDQTKIAEKESELQAVQEQLIAKDEEITSLGSVETDYEELQSRYAQLESEITEMKTAAEEAAKEAEKAAKAAEAETEVAEEADEEAAESTEMSSEVEEAENAALLAEKDSLLAEKDSALAEKENALAEKDSLLAEKDTLLAEKDSALAAKDSEFEEKEAEYQAQAAELQDQIAKILSVRSEIIASLQEAFDETELPVTVNEKNGIITLDSSILFGFNSSGLTEDGMKVLDEVLPKYFEVLNKEEVKEYVSEVIIEGHTDTVGDYLYNLYLSQKRAFTVADYYLDPESNILTKEQAEELGKIVTANGRSFSEPVLNENGEVDADASRRVELEFRLLSDDLLSEASE